MGVEDFASDSPILASSYQPSFLDRANRPEHTLCKRLGLEVPEYDPVLVDHESLVMFKGITTGLQVLHTPGHTPDELALWDVEEHMLYVGDTVYEFSPIIFPKQGDIIVWLKSMRFLIDFVESREADGISGSQVMINSGHDTSMGNALDVLIQGKTFIEDVIAERVPIKDATVVDGVKVIHCVRDDERFSLSCPEELILCARNSRL